MFCWYRTAVPLLDVWRRSQLDQFNKQAIWIDKANQLLIKSRSRSLRRHVFLSQPLQPVANRILRNCECHSIDLACPAHAASSARPREKRHDCSGGPARITEIKMIRAGIIEIHGALDEAKSEDASVKIQIALWIAGNRSDVMESANF